MKKKTHKKHVTKVIDHISARMAKGKPDRIVRLPNDRTGMVEIWTIDHATYEKAVRVGLASMIATKQSRPSRLNPVLIRYLRKHRKANTLDLWKQLQKHDIDDTPLKVPGGWMGFSRKDRKKLVIDSREIKNLEGQQTFTYKTFAKYHHFCKNPLSRTK